MKTKIEIVAEVPMTDEQGRKYLNIVIRVTVNDLMQLREIRMYERN